MIPRGPVPIIGASTSAQSGQQVKGGVGQTSKAPTGQHSAASSLNMRPSGQDANWKSSVHASDPSGPGRPPILDAGLVSNVQDFVAPISLDRLTHTYPTFLTRMSSYYDSLVSRNDHLYAPPKDLVARSSEPSHAHYSSENTCFTCGKRSTRDCRFRRCKNCCNGSLLKCQVHSVGFTPQPGQQLQDWPSNAPAQPAATNTTAVTKPTRPSAPIAPKASMFILGDRESTEPWLELREEALYRSQQNHLAMETIFDLQSIDSVHTWLRDWQGKPLQALENQTAQQEENIHALHLTHQNTLSKWTERAAKFSTLLEEIDAALGDPNTLAQLKTKFTEDLNGQIAVPLTTRKRSPPDGDLPNQPPNKVKAN